MSKIVNLSYFSIYRNMGSRKRGAPSAPLTISGLTCKRLVGAPTCFFVHLQGHQRAPGHSQWAFDNDETALFG